MFLSETRLYKGPNITNYTVYDLENDANMQELHCVHGIQVYISDYLASACIKIVDIDANYNSVLWIKVSDMFILGAVYLPHENSKYHYSGLFDDLSYDICKIKSKYDLPFILIGDFNSRTGTMDDFITMDQNDLIVAILNILTL